MPDPMGKHMGVEAAKQIREAVDSLTRQGVDLHVTPSPEALEVARRALEGGVQTTVTVDPETMKGMRDALKEAKVEVSLGDKTTKDLKETAKWAGFGIGGSILGLGALFGIKAWMAGKPQRQQRADDLADFEMLSRLYQGECPTNAAEHAIAVRALTTKTGPIIPRASEAFAQCSMLAKAPELK